MPRASELAERQIPTARGPEPDHYDEMDDAQLATQARALRIGILTLPAQYMVSERYVQRVSFDIRQSA